MVYRRPYFTSGSSGFALIAISGAMKKDIKVIFQLMTSLITSTYWTEFVDACFQVRGKSKCGSFIACSADCHILLLSLLAFHSLVEENKLIISTLDNGHKMKIFKLFTLKCTCTLLVELVLHYYYSDPLVNNIRYDLCVGIYRRYAENPKELDDSNECLLGRKG